MGPNVTILDTLPLWGDRFTGPSRAAWRAVLALMFGLPVDDDQRVLLQRCTGRALDGPQPPAREAWLIVGRRGGKSEIAALIAVYLACFRTYALKPGERGTLMILAADRRQARVVKGYVSGLLTSVPMIAALVANETKESIELSNGITIEIQTASFRSVRGYTVVGAIADEVAFWQNDDSANPDAEILAALRPAMATVPGALFVAISSPYARRGELYRVHREHFGKDGDPLLVVQADTRTFNPTVPQSVIDAEYESDPARASAEYGAQFRSDVESLITSDALAACVVLGRYEQPRLPGTSYRVFLDFAGGSGQDSATLAIAHTEVRDGLEVFVLDAIREVRPPFSPDRVCVEFADTLRSYGLSRAVSDKWGGLFVVEQMRKHGIHVEPSAKAKSDLYAALLPLVNAGRAELLDHPRLLNQLAALERRTARGGRDSIDHAPGGHDDLANAVAGALTTADTCLYRVRTFV